MRFINHFYPRPPRGGRLTAQYERAAAALFLSTPSARRATPADPGRPGTRSISIHALREEGDVVFPQTIISRVMISIHALREEGDPTELQTHKNKRFLSTPSARRATRIDVADGLAHLHFYPRPPRGGRPNGFPVDNNAFLFLSTPSARRATVHPERDDQRPVISIHALREEGDISALSDVAKNIISIHALREEGDWLFQ